ADAPSVLVGDEREARRILEAGHRIRAGRQVFSVEDSEVGGWVAIRHEDDADITDGSPVAPWTRREAIDHVIQTARFTRPEAGVGDVVAISGRPMRIERVEPNGDGVPVIHLRNIDNGKRQKLTPAKFRQYARADLRLDEDPAGANKAGPPNVPGNPHRREDGSLAVEEDEHDLSGELRRAQTRMREIAEDMERADALYNAIPDAEGGKVIGTDIARFLSPDYSAGELGSNRRREAVAKYLHATSRVASAYAKDRLRREIMNRGDRKVLMFTAGGVAAGKSSAIGPEEIEIADLIFDGTMRKPKRAIDDIRRALNQGWGVSVHYVHRPFELVVQGAIERADRTGRWGPLDELPEIHRTAQQSFLAVARHFADDPRVQIIAHLNAGTAENPVPSEVIPLKDLDKNGRFHYNQGDEQALQQIVQRVYERAVLGGRYDEAILERIAEPGGEERRLRTPAAVRQAHPSDYQDAEQRRSEEDGLSGGRPAASTPPDPSDTPPTRRSILDNLSQAKRARAEALKKRLADKLGTELRSGIDPELLAIGAELGTLYIEAGARSFSRFARAVASDFAQIPPRVVKSMYLGSLPLIEDRQGTDRAGDVDDLSDAQVTQAMRTGDTTRWGESTGESAAPERSEGTIEAEETRDDDTRRDDSTAQRPDDPAASPAPDRRGESDAEAADEAVQAAHGSASEPGQPGGQRERDARRADDRARRTTVAEAEPGRAEDAAEGGRAGRRGSGDARGGDAAPQPDLTEPANHVIEPGDALAPRGDVAKFNANLTALELLATLEKEGRPATAEERKTLAQYTGWGWIGEAFNPDNPRYKKQYAKLRELVDRGVISEDDYRAARTSTINAHYTSPEVIGAMWQMARRLGFTGGEGTTILEPAMGIGHFFGLLPETMRGGRLVGVELDNLSARISRKLYPAADIRHEGFQATRIPNGSVDLAISNVPFDNSRVPGAKDYPDLYLHDYFFARALDKVKPGGLVLFITSDGTLNKVDKRVRQLIAEKADLLGAVRLPNNAFQANAGTEVTTDILVLRKKGGAPLDPALSQPFQNLATVGQATVEGEEVPIRANEYFAAHPEMALGEHTLAGTMYAANDYALVAKRGQDTAALLAQAAERLPADVFGPEAATTPPAATSTGEASQAGEKELSYVERDGTIYQVQDGQLAEPDWLTRRNWGEKADEPLKPIKRGKTTRSVADQVRQRKQIARDWVALRNLVRELFTAENTESASDGELRTMRERLNRQYDAYKKRWGTLTRTQRQHERANFLEDDPDYPLMQAIEDEQTYFDAKAGKEKKRWVKGDLFRKRLRRPRAMPARAESIEDAINLSLGHHAAIREQVIAELLDTTPEAAREQAVSSGRAFENPETGLLETREKYLSGNVRKKLAAARRAAEEEDRYQPNVEALEAVQPATIPLGQIRYQLGARWVPTDVLEKFVEDTLGTPATIRYLPAANAYTLRAQNKHTPQITTTYGTSKMDALKLLEHALAGTEPSLSATVGTGSSRRTVPDKEGTQAARSKLENLRRAFVTWVRTSGASVEVDGEPVLVQERLEREYNETNNAVVAPKYDGKHLALPGITDKVYRTDHRMA
ncbi:MAG: zeta toxin family protein, partial [Phycisphaeraceae bacterium]